MSRRCRAAVPILLTAATATTAGAQTVDPIFAHGFQPGLRAFIPAFTAAAEGALGTYPMSSGPLRVVLDAAAGVDTFVPIASSEPSRLVVVGGGVTVPAGLNNALVTVNALVAGAEPVTLWAKLGNTMGAGVRVERALNQTDSPGGADHCKLVFPLFLSVAVGVQTDPIFARLFEQGVTDASNGPTPGWIGEVGHGPFPSDPRTLAGWRFSPATFDSDPVSDPLYDEYRATFVAQLPPATYSYTYRFSSDGGGSWTYCDIDGAGASSGLSFDPLNLGVLTVTAQ